MDSKSLNEAYYINLHTHHVQERKDVWVVRNLFPEEYKRIKDFSAVSMGIHPWYPDHWAQKLQQMEENILNLAAIGEAGLDKECNTPFDLQMIIFQKQMDLAEKYDKPVIIHGVKAYSELLQMKKKGYNHQVWIFHGFTARKQVAEQFLPLRCFFSFGKALLKKNSKVQETFKSIPVENIFFETDDDPYVQIDEVYKRGAKIKRIELQELVSAVFYNYKRVFNYDA